MLQSIYNLVCIHHVNVCIVFFFSEVQEGGGAIEEGKEGKESGRRK